MSNADRLNGERLNEDPRVTRTRELIDQAFYDKRVLVCGHTALDEVLKSTYTWYASIRIQFILNL